MKKLLDALEAGDAAARSGEICRRLVGTKAWKEAGAVLIFLSMPSEVDTAPIIAAARKEGKAVACPRVDGGSIAFHLLPDGAMLTPGVFGIREPDASSPRFDWGTGLDGGRILIVVPGLAFDGNRRRLGRGKGFYDRILAEAGVRAPGRTTALAVCFSGQLLDEVPHGPSDLPVDLIVTENEVIE
jgi:5-formyltetrahydrofolate cyclo-ligase